MGQMGRGLQYTLLPRQNPVSIVNFYTSLRNVPKIVMTGREVPHQNTIYKLQIMVHYEFPIAKYRGFRFRVCNFDPTDSGRQGKSG
jgi:hypothetical protein